MEKGACSVEKDEIGHGAPGIEEATSGKQILTSNSAVGHRATARAPVNRQGSQSREPANCAKLPVGHHLAYPMERHHSR
jgi:hypothetical protein